MTIAADALAPTRDSAAEERWFAALIATRSQLRPEAREQFDLEHADAIKSRSEALRSGD